MDGVESDNALQSLMREVLKQIIAEMEQENAK
jgi:hypothetical protein